MPTRRPLLPDKYLWLEDVHGARAMDWVKAEDARSAKILEADPRFANFSAEALKVSEDPNRLPLPELRGDEIYNFWRDKNNVHGILRKTSIADFANPNPHWQTVLDIDALGKKENTSWVFHGMSCLYPGTRYCTIVSLRRRRRRLHRSRIRPQDRPVRRQRLHLAAQQAETSPGRTKTPSSSPANGDPTR